ncbi:MAG: hypothetical protein M3460_03560 [Actinomycetota bacterium]|nr:hypothetical protein [Actinomycetota bacterium]
MNDPESLDVGSQIELLLERVHQARSTRLDGFFFDDGERIWHGATGVAVALDALVETGYLHLQSIRPPELENSPRLEDHVGLTVAERTRRGPRPVPDPTCGAGAGISLGPALAWRNLLAEVYPPRGDGPGASAGSWRGESCRGR